jgi:hypothetical protein
MMKKYIEIEEEVYVRLLEGKYVEGSMHRDKWSKVIVFNAYNRLPRKRKKDELVKKTPWGGLKASVARYKRYLAIPNELSLEEQLALFDEENELAKNALIERYLINGV